ncbi:MAG TPA: DUF1569 domain-containing protein [Bryobacteraceae bacterium]|nr:DUF1569 domain-containing protein [Bryobacteraceae bacterium]
MNTLQSTTTQQEILHRIAQLSELDKPQWGIMSVHQMICHLRDSYCIALGERTASPATGLIQRTLIKGIALWVPVKWQKGYATRPEVEQGKGGSLPGEFEADRRALESVFHRFCDYLPQPCLPHPVFGPMKAQDWWRWGYLHADHHLRQFGR